MKRSLLLTLFALATVLAPAAARAQVRDNGDFFSAQTESQLGDALSRIQSRTGKKVLIETFAQVPPDLRGEMSQPDFWERFVISRGKADSADIVIVVTRDPSHMEIGANERTRNSGHFNASDKKAVSDTILTAFRAKQFDSGILRGVDLIEQRLTAGGPSRAAAPAPGSGGTTGSPRTSTGGGVPSGGPGGTYGTPQPTRSNCGGGSLICLLVGVVIAVLLLRGIFGGRRQTPQAPYGYNPQTGYPQQPPPPPGGYPYGGGGGGGGFGRGVAGGVLGGLLGGWLGNRAFGQHPNASSSSTPMDNNYNPVDPGPVSTGGDFGDSSSSGFSSGGGDFGGGGGGGDFGGGGGDSGGGDVSTGGDF